VGDELFAFAAAIRTDRSFHCDTDFCRNPYLSFAALTQCPRMMTVPVEIRRSDIHGQGVFALEKIPDRRVVWTFHPGLDFTLSDYAVRYADPDATEFIYERGYLNPDRPQWVVCIDEAQFLNFPKEGEKANLALGGEMDGQRILIAARAIEPGEELTVPPESDGDYPRKIKKR
jgi:hypothetical protein